LHCRSTRLDGALTPEALKNLYKGNAYDILVITDHCNPKNHSALNDDNFLFLTGYEADIRPDPNGRYNIFGRRTTGIILRASPKICKI